MTAWNGPKAVKKASMRAVSAQGKRRAWSTVRSRSTARIVIVCLWRSMPTYLIAALRVGVTEIGEALKVYPTLGVAAVGSASFIVSPGGGWPGFGCHGFGFEPV